MPVAPRFEITRFSVENNTLLPAAEIDRVVAPFAGKQKDFSDIQRALESLEQAYSNRGYSLVQVLLPEQDITRGVVRFRVLEPRIGKVVVEGNKFYDATNVRASLPALKPGSTPESNKIARNLQLLAEHPTKQTTVLLKSGDTETGCTIHVVDDEYDHGPVVAQAKVAVAPGDTAETLAARVQAREQTLYVETLKRIFSGEIDLDRL